MVDHHIRELVGWKRGPPLKAGGEGTEKLILVLAVDEDVAVEEVLLGAEEVSGQGSRSEDSGAN